MNIPASKQEHEILVNDLREAYMEIFPAKGIEEKLRVLQPDSYVAAELRGLTCGLLLHCSTALIGPSTACRQRRHSRQ